MEKVTAVVRASTAIPFSEADPKILATIKGVCFDIDDTFSTDGKLTPTAYEALWKLHEAGFKTIPVTGRPAGWCDHIARFWPVDGVIGENGAFVFYMHNGTLDRFDLLPASEMKQTKEKLQRLAIAIHKRFPHARFASDQKYREYDLAIDFSEDVDPWSEHEIAELLALCDEHEATSKVSSIHVNTWFGDYNKQTAIKHWLGRPGMPGFSQWLYIGDSPNDEPAFELFPYSVGVRNILSFIDRLEHKPTWITAQKSGEGFVEMAERLLRCRAS